MSITAAPPHKPRLSVVTGDSRQRSMLVQATVGSDRPTSSETTDKGAFVRRCLTDNPAMRVADIQRRATSQGIKIAHSYISDIAKPSLPSRESKHSKKPRNTNTQARKAVTVQLGARKNVSVVVTAAENERGEAHAVSRATCH